MTSPRVDLACSAGPIETRPDDVDGFAEHPPENPKFAVGSSRKSRGATEGVSGVALRGDAQPHGGASCALRLEESFILQFIEDEADGRIADSG